MNASRMTHLDSALLQNIDVEQMFEQCDPKAVIYGSCKRVTELYPSKPVCSLVMLTSAFTHLTSDMANSVMTIVENRIMKHVSEHANEFDIDPAPV